VESRPYQKKNSVYLVGVWERKYMRIVRKSSVEGVSTVGDRRRLCIPSSLRNLQNGLWEKSVKGFKVLGVERGKDVGILFCPHGGQEPDRISLLGFFGYENDFYSKVDNQWRIVLPHLLMEEARIKIWDKVTLYVGQWGLEVWNSETWRKIKYANCAIYHYWPYKYERCFFRDAEQFYVYPGNRSHITKIIKGYCSSIWERDSRALGFHPCQSFCILEFATKCFLIRHEFKVTERFSFNRMEESLRFYDKYFGLGVPKEIVDIKYNDDSAIITIVGSGSVPLRWISQIREPNLSLGKKYGIFDRVVNGVYVLKELVEKE
jgi:bifunctional DNA-binding transcriptional regulator/antitoxin component of YhaV-PrlF toxin-antitoxin module